MRSIEGRRWPRRLLIVAALLAFWSSCLEPRHLVVRHRRLALPQWSSAPLRVALLGDLHVGAPPMDRGHLRSVLARVQSTEPDLIVFLGDLMDTKSVFRADVSPRRVGEDLRTLSAPLGVFAVLGNHDHWYGRQRVLDALEHGGVRWLSNESVRLRPGAPFHLVGVDDEFTGHADIDAALRDVPADASALLVTHTPDLFPRVPARVALTAAAHTHGGQVRVPFAGPLFVPSRYGARYARGHVVEEGRHLFVTSGVGNSMVPVRFGVPPELLVLELR